MMSYTCIVKLFKNIDKSNPNYKGIKYICENCGVEFVTYSNAKRFCSLKCFWEKTKSKETKECIVCNKLFEGYPNRKHCSYKCSLITRHKNSRKITKCKICNNKIEQLKSQNKMTCSKYCLSMLKSKQTKGENNPRWLGGRFTEKETGYIRIYSPKHPNAISGKWVYEHRLVMEKHLGRYLKRKEIIHHIDGNTGNNDINNLRVMLQSEHAKTHNRIKDNLGRYT